MDPSQQLGFQPMQLQEPIGAFQQQAMPNFQASKTKMSSTISKEKNEDKHAKSTLLVVFSCFCLVVILFCCCIFVGDEVNDLLGCIFVGDVYLLAICSLPSLFSGS